MANWIDIYDGNEDISKELEVLCPGDLIDDERVPFIDDETFIKNPIGCMGFTCLECWNQERDE